MTRSFLTRIVTGTVALALLALAATGAAGTAHADDPIVISPTTPTMVGPAPSPSIVVGPLLPMPDLVVKFESATCGYYPESGGLRILMKIRVINMTNTPALKEFFTEVRMDGVQVAGSPHKMLVPLWTTEVFHLNIDATPGTHALTAFTDSTFQNVETNETNNKALTRVTCPAS